MSKEQIRDIHGIGINSLLKELWNIQMIQKVSESATVLEWTEMFLVNHITEQYGIKNLDGEFYILVDRLFAEKPLWPPTIGYLLKECEKEGILLEDKNGN